jgi:hypothetical protein
MRRLFMILGVAALAASGGQAWATSPQLPETSGEASPVLSCFYECKRQIPRLRYVWKEATTLMLASTFGHAELRVVFYDDDQNMIARTDVDLMEFDLDELYVCRTLWAGGARVPEKGLIEVVHYPNNGVFPTYGWVKNLAGLFNGYSREPFRGRNQEVTGIGKTECRVTPPSVADPFDILDASDDAQYVPPRLIEGTAEPTQF